MMAVAKAATVAVAVPAIAAFSSARKNIVISGSRTSTLPWHPAYVSCVWNSWIASVANVEVVGIVAASVSTSIGNSPKTLIKSYAPSWSSAKVVYNTM